ncbi:palmdelphin isoform X5 [Hippoglossus hippoglossus]|uniref:palmdelphin isoform X5 n=1 Tax=Hippoglossus hippoglossus TaxID=8267 RepID=UPI00148B83A5|nr:palmdelphin isoform X5 [Hippoglossus hippoglossus]
MDEANLLKERLQAITDKRRIQEDIAKKRREIEEEKLKLQYIKKKALREHWLMDGLSQQSEQEQEATRLQIQDEQQQSDQLQSHILRKEEEIKTLEDQELNISANEEVVLKRLKEVERTAEDIIKELNADYQADVTHHLPSPLPDIPSFIPLTPAETPPICKPGSEETKKATFAMEINVEHDKRTGKSQVVSTASITPDIIQGRGLKVYDDGRKSVYALHPDGSKMDSGAVGEMTTTEVEELLRQATDKNIPTEVQYHQPVYSLPYKSSSRPSTPRTPNQTQTQSPTPSRSPSQSAVSSRTSTEVLTEENQHRNDLEGWKTQSKTPSPSLVQQDSMTRFQKSGEETKLPFFHIPEQSKSDKRVIPQPDISAKTPQGLTNYTTGSILNTAALVSIKARSEEMPAPIQPVYRAVDSHSPSLGSLKSEGDPDTLIESSRDFNRPFCAESTSSLNLVDELESAPVTMIFMGYENAEYEEEDIQAELIIIADDDDEDDDDDDDKAKYVKNESDGEECLSYHPEGYKSKVFQPKVGIAKVTGCRDIIEDTYWDDLELHKPTFIHRPGKQSPYLQGQAMDVSANTGSINMEKMKLCSTGR